MVNISTKPITNLIDDTNKESKLSNIQDLASNIQHHDQIRENIIDELKNKYNIPREKVINDHEKEVRHLMQNRIMNDQHLNELPETGESDSKSGLWASVIALLGGLTLLSRRKNKKEDK